MKTKQLLLLLILLVPSLVVLAQRRIELTPFAGYQFGGSVHYNEGKLKFDDNAVYGGEIGVEVSHNMMAVFTYNYMGTMAHFEPYYSQYQAYDFNGAMQYFLLGVEKEIGNQFKGYGKFSMGAAWFDSHDPKVSDAVKFAIGLGLGGKLMFSKVVGIKLQGRLLLPMTFAGVGAYYGAGTGGTGGGLTVNSFATVVQGDFTGGLIFCIGNAKKN
jgi:hypothetical protein